MKIKKTLSTITPEQILFLVITLVHLIPLFFVPIFATLDGGAHVYNSHLMKELLFGDKEFIGRFHSFNFMLLPNVMGHIILAFFQLFSSDIVAEKIFQVTYIVSFAYSFRYLSFSIYPKEKVMAYLGFIFIYSFLFFLGFYNYCISLPFFFLALGYWLRHPDLNSLNNKIVLGLLVLFVFLGHIFSFVLLLFSIGVFILLEFIDGTKRNRLEGSFSILSSKVLKLTLVTLPTLILTAIYLKKFAASGEITYLSLHEKIKYFIRGRLLISFNMETEKPFTTMMMVFICFLFILNIFYRFYKFKKEERNENPIHVNSILLLVFLFGIIYLLIPESMASGEYMTIRMLIMLVIFIVLSSGSWMYKLKGLRWILVLIPLFLNAALTKDRLPQIYHEGDVVLEYYKIGKNIPPHSIVLPLTNSNDWFNGHFCNYIGLDKPVIILDNYEAVKGYFPILWKSPNNPAWAIGDIQPPKFCLNINRYENNSKERVDYITFWNQKFDKNEPCNLELSDLLKNEYSIVSEAGNMKLYKRNNFKSYQKTLIVDFENSDQYGTVDSIAYTGKKAFVMLSNKETEFSPGIMETAGSLGIKDGKEIEFSGYIYPQNSNSKTKLVFMTERNKKAVIYKQIELSTDITALKWSKVGSHLIVSDIQDSDIVKVYFWQQSGPIVFVDHIELNRID